MRRIIQWVLIFAIGIFILGLLSAGGAFLYVYFHKEEIIARVKDSVNNSLQGELVTGKINVDFLHYFPSAAIHITDVSLRDSLFNVHHKELLSAKDIYIKINFRELFSLSPALENITLKNGNFYLFTDVTGYTNKYLLQGKSKKKSTGINSYLNELNLVNFRFVLNDQLKGKYHNIFFSRLKCGIQMNDNIISFALKSNGKIKMLGFNLKKGAYARDATFKNNLIFYYNKTDTVLEIPEHTFYLNQNLIAAKARFKFGDTPYLSADITAPRILFSNALNVLTEITKKKLSKYILERPLRISLHLEGALVPGVSPFVRAELSTSANTFVLKQNKFTNCRMNTVYTNRTDSLLAASPANSAVEIKKFSAYWNGIPVQSESVRFFNFPFPSATGTLEGSFPMSNMNKLPGGELYHFSKGTGNYIAVINATSDSTGWNNEINLSMDIRKCALVYVPRNIAFHDINASIIIKKNDLIIQNASCISGSSLLTLEGKAPGLFDTDLKDLKQAKLIWEIKSPLINLNDFIAFLSKRKGGDVKTYSEKSNFGKHLERYLDACSLNMNLNIEAVKYDNFTATALAGKVQLIDDKWSLNDIRFKHADGDVSLSGNLTPTSEYVQAVNIKTKLSHVNIADVFTAFDNFSQKNMTANQINGTVDANIILGFNINNKASISQSSIYGRVDLSITDGAIKGFQPLGKLSKFIFRKRDFTDIRFSELTNSFEARGSEIYFDRMKINSSVMELYAEGSVFMDGKTDMHIQIPLSNLKSRDWSELSDNITDQGEKGMNVYIHAETDDKGELKFKYDPLKKLKDNRSKR